MGELALTRFCNRRVPATRGLASPSASNCACFAGQPLGEGPAGPASCGRFCSCWPPLHISLLLDAVATVSVTYYAVYHQCGCVPADYSRDLTGPSSNEQSDRQLMWSSRVRRAAISDQVKLAQEGSREWRDRSTRMAGKPNTKTGSGNPRGICLLFLCASRALPTYAAALCSGHIYLREHKPTRYQGQVRSQAESKPCRYLTRPTPMLPWHHHFQTTEAIQLGLWTVTGIFPLGRPQWQARKLLRCRA